MVRTRGMWIELKSTCAFAALTQMCYCGRQLQSGSEIYPEISGICLGTWCAFSGRGCPWVCGADVEGGWTRSCSLSVPIAAWDGRVVPPARCPLEISGSSRTSSWVVTDLLKSRSIPAEDGTAVGAHGVPEDAPVSWRSWAVPWDSCCQHLKANKCIRSWPLFAKYELVFLPAWEVLRSEGDCVQRESHVFFDPFRRYYFCCLAWDIQGPLWNGVLGNVSSVPYWYLDYGKRADLKSDISILYFVKVICVQISKKILLIPSVVFLCWIGNL